MEDLGVYGRIELKWVLETDQNEPTWLTSLPSPPPPLWCCWADHCQLSQVVSLSEVDCFVLYVMRLFNDATYSMLPKTCISLKNKLSCFLLRFGAILCFCYR
jgi:hypothetical protein